MKIIDEFYEAIFSLLPTVRSVVDVACGFHPLAVPWMPLSGNVKYYACDIYVDLVAFLNRYFGLIDIDGYAETREVVQSPPEVKADLAFVLNAVPCLEQIEKSAGLKVLDSINADFLVVSFPVRSLGGRKKGMQEFYEASFISLAQEKRWSFQQLEMGTELGFVVQKGNCDRWIERLACLFQTGFSGYI